jgi:glycosyltransferase involved in cell wall biosynthesis
MDRDFTIIPTGHDHEKFKPAGEKANRVLTVGYLGRNGEGEVKRKGLDLFIEAARLMPNVEFMAIGITSKEALTELMGPMPSNLRIFGLIPNDQLVQFYQGAKVYCQLSMHEGLPSALCEGMLCECVPVGTNVSAITSVIGDTGFIVPTPNPQEVADTILKALSSDLGGKARQRIIENFSKEARERNLSGVIDELFPISH